MKKLINKYAELLLKCLCLDNKDYLFVVMPSFLTEFKEALDEEAEVYNLKGIHYELEDSFKKRDILLNLDQENINKHPMFDHAEYNRYAKLDAAFLFIQSSVPNIYKDIPPKKLKDTTKHVRTTEKYFRSLYETDKLNWCIAGVPNKYWATEGLKMSENDLWQLIYKICLVDEECDPYQKWLNKLNKLEKTASILNNYDFDYLQYQNSLGTDLRVYLPEGHIWCSGTGINGTIANLPTEEIFTSPTYNKTEGIVYSSKPLVYNNVLIEDFYLEFKEGKVVNYDAKQGKEILKNIIEMDDYSCYLGECALVSFDSPINNTNIIFNETLYDENASCHLALGRGFNECLKNSESKNDDDLRALGVNSSNTHVDFMIGTKDLTITGVTKEGQEISIMQNGNLII